MDKDYEYADVYDITKIPKEDIKLWKNRIRQRDRSFFIRTISFQYVGGKEVDHDWSNGCVCRLISKKANLEMMNIRKEHRNGRK